MTALWTSSEIAAATGGISSGDFEVNGVAFDSREVGQGDLFIALTGETTDGHRFIDQAFAQGAGGAIVSTPAAYPHVLVRDTAAALDALGIAARKRTKAKIAGVTGSVGKTGTKEALAAALARANRGSVHRSVKSYNNHTGVPLSLARTQRDTAFGVYEMGMNHAGELATLTKLVRPHVALITAIAPAHIEFFANGIDGIADAKGEIFEGLESGGTAIVPFDSPHCARLIRHAKSHAETILTFGRGEGADVRILDEIPTADGTIVSIAIPDGEVSFTLGLPGAHWVSNAAAVIAAVYALGGDLAAAGIALADFEGLPGRGAHVRIARDGGHAVLIDESYNANPTSMAATLAVLRDTPAERRIAVLGAMRELGADSDALHAGIADDVIASGAAIVLLVGSGIEPLAKALEGQCDVRHVPDVAAALELLEEAIRPGDTILIKGSNAIGLGQIVLALKGGQN